MSLPGGGPIEVSIPYPAERRAAGARVHRRAGLRPADLTRHDGIPVTTPALTLVDLAGASHPALERVVNEADRLDLIDPEALRTALAAVAQRLAASS